MMEWLHNQLWHDGRICWWVLVGWLGSAIFGSRFFVQWYATEKKKQVVVPVAFWWLSLAGSLILLAYALIYKHDSVFILSFIFSWIPYVRNLIIHRRHEDAQIKCASCGTVCPPKSNFCLACGTRLDGQSVAPATAGR